MGVQQRKAFGRRRRKVPGFVLAVVLTLALVGCGGSDTPSDSDAPAVGGTLTLGVARDFGSLDPAVDNGSSGGAISFFLVYATLVERDPADGTYVPGLAETFGYVGEGNKTYELTLRDDAKFADGTPVNAEAVKKWFEYYPTAPGTTTGQKIEIASIETPDDLTVRINLKTPSPNITDDLSNGWGMVVAPSELKNKDAMAAGPIGAGPYVYDRENTVTGQGGTYTLVPNEHYYDQSKIHWEKVVVKSIADPTAMLRAMQSGQIDVAEGSLTTFEAAQGAGLDVTTAQGGYAEVYFTDSAGSRVEALGDVRVRQALNYAIDRESIAESLFHGAAEPTSTTIASDFTNSDVMDLYPYDPDKAKDLLAEAGYADGFEFGVVAQSSGTVTGKQLTQAVVQNWADVGVTVDLLEPATTSELFAQFLSREAFILEYQSQAFPLFAGRMPGRYINPYDVPFPELEDLIAQAQTAPPESQESLMYEIERITAENAYAAPIVSRPTILYANTDTVSGAEATDWLAYSPVSREWTPAS